MNEKVTLLKFVRKTSDYGSDSSFVARIPPQIRTVRQLLNVLYETLNFPGYFGFNWDALSDCLRDLHWLNEQTIAIVHEDLSQLSDRDIRIYLEILLDSIADWKSDTAHCLVVVFPEIERTKIGKLLNG